LNRPVSRTDEFGNTIQYNYDSAGNLVALTYSDGKTVYYGYDELNRLTSVTDWSGRTTSYGYDAAGNLASARSPDGSVVTYSYDASRRLIGVEDRDPAGEVIYRCQYTLNEAGLRIAEVVEAPLEPRAEVKPKHFAYNAANQLVSDGENDFYYDADGNMVEGAIGGATRTLVYDELNRLVSVGADEYRYDAEGVRIESRIGGGTVRNVYDPYGPFPRLLEQHDGNGRVIARYVYGLGLIGSENARTRDYSVYHFDSRGSTVATTDDSGHIRTRYAYDPYGRVVERRGPGNAQGAAYGAPWNPFTFAGRWGVVDDGNGLYKMGSRYYAPELMRFVHRDQQFSGKLSDPQSLNRYAYALGNPIHVIDPSGNYFILDDIIMSLIGVIVNMGSLLIGDLISGEWSSWLDYMGAFIGGIAWGETFLYTGNPLAAGFVSAAVESGWKMLTMLFASPWMFALTGETPNWEALGIQAGIEIGISTVLSIGGKAPSGLQKKFTAKAIAKAFGKPLWKVAVMKYVGGPAALLAKRAVTKGAGGAFKGFFIRGDRWGVRDHIPVVATSIVFMGALIPELVWDPLWP
jgi:RHS repeat-associated protein